MKKTAVLLLISLCFLAGIRSYSQSWTELNSNSSATLYGCHFVDPDVAFFVGSGGEIVRTENGGSSVTTYYSGSTDLYDVFFTDENTGYVVGDNGKILKTTDGGDSWYPQNSYTQNNLRCVRCY